ncbi:MAG TPA: DUF5715 family protein [Longimicrobiales bacterium]|nr:DUF5715 family protein [Longimicrobiales bacterium]
MNRWFPTATMLLIICSCSPAGVDDGAGNAAESDGERIILERELQRIDGEAARIDSLFQPLPLLRPSDESALTRFGNAQQLTRARALGVGRLLSAARLDELRRAGALVLLEDSKYWVIRGMQHAQPLAVPSAHALLTEIGTRFHARLRDIDAPAFRMEVTSVLRSAEDQAALRRVNPNAAAGESTHEYGTTFDVLYSAFAAPTQPIVQIDAGEAAWLGPFLVRHATVTAERVAGRRAHELKSILAAC